MNKFDSFIYDFLVSQKEVAIAKIGVLQATSENITIAQGSEQVSIPKVNFTYNRRVETSPELTAYIAEKLGKNKMLIDADLDSYFEQVRQFINLGKPYLLPQIGAIVLNKQGEYEFSQQHNETYATEDKAQRQYYQSDAGHTEIYRARRKNSIAGIAIVVVVLIVAGLGWGAYTLFFNKPKTPATSGDAVSAPPVAEPAKPATALVDSSGRMPDSLAQKQAATAAAPAPQPVAGAGDSVDWKFVFETTTSSERAHTRTAQLQSFGDPARFDSVSRNNETVYRLFLRSRGTIADTARMRDSLETYFQRKVSVER